jgi:catechol 2,3-dioxygenase-like lactoylglutathione lyase family enzyme
MNDRQARLVLMCGLPTAGKATLAREMDFAYGAVRLSADEWMLELGTPVILEWASGLDRGARSYGTWRARWKRRLSCTTWSCHTRSPSGGSSSGQLTVASRSTAEHVAIYRGQFEPPSGVELILSSHRRRTSSACSIHALADSPVEYDGRVKLTKIDAITLFVEDPRLSRTFYERVFEAEKIMQDDHSVAFMFDGAVINLLSLAAAPELISPASVAGEDGGNSAVMTLAVDDVDATCTELEDKGVVLLNGPMDRPWGIRTASFCDPDGHIWEIAAKLPAG